MGGELVKKVMVLKLSIMSKNDKKIRFAEGCVMQLPLFRLANSK